MANEINLNFILQVNNAAFRDAFAPLPMSLTQTNVGVAGGVQSIPITDTLVAGLTGLTANGYAVLQNLDTTHYVLWGPDNGSGAMVVLGKLKPGECAVVRIAPTVVLRAQADTAAVKLLVRVWED
jgi:hypothetical protein